MYTTIEGVFIKISCSGLTLNVNYCKIIICA